VLGLYAIIRSGGKQLRVEPGQTVNIERLPAEVGTSIDLNEVLMFVGDGEPLIGQPMVSGAKVRARVVAQGKGRKILVFRYKAKKNVRKRQGHRQPFTTIRIEGIDIP